MSMQLIVSGGHKFKEQASRLLESRNLGAVLSKNMSETEVLDFFKDVDVVFTDADGTVVKEGMTGFPEAYARAVSALAKAGTKVVLLTGKPYEEVSALLASLPTGSPLEAIYEKGAYCLRPDNLGGWRKDYLLTTPELEHSVAELKSRFIKEKESLEKKYGIFFGWSGDGNHKSILSIDIYGQKPPANYLQLRGLAREDLKVEDTTRRAEVESALEDFVNKYQPGWRVVHLGNGNTDIAPGPIEKDLAIKLTSEYQEARHVLVWGDTENDRQMFNLQKSSDKVKACLVLHRPAGLQLLDAVDLVSFGMANSGPYFDLVLRAKHIE